MDSWLSSAESITFVLLIGLRKAERPTPGLASSGALRTPCPSGLQQALVAQERGIVSAPGYHCCSCACTAQVKTQGLLYCNIHSAWG